MPPINIYKCSQCDVVFHRGWVGYQYVENDSGERVCCRHPGEEHTVREVLGISKEEYNRYKSNRWEVYINLQKPASWWSTKRRAKHKEQQKQIEDFAYLVQSRTGYNSDCVCQDCLTQFALDLGDEEEHGISWREFYGAFNRKDERLCPHCGSKNVRSVMELIGQVCPHCKQGKVIAINTGSVS